MNGIDLRSDTITRPSKEMRQAMAEADVGDDVLGEDPTVAALEARVARLLGKEAAVFFPTGVMANQTAIHVHTRPGEEVVVAENAHVHFYETGASSMLSQVMLRTIEAPTGIFGVSQLDAKLRRPNVHFPRTSLVCVENTTNLGGGRVWPLATLAEVAARAHERGLRVHMDGARLWNASVASGIPEAEYARHCDTVSVCFSKGLGAPVGSCLAGPAGIMPDVRRTRKAFGGGMRQAGVIAAGALYALEHNHDRLAVDHANAKVFAQELAKVPEVAVDPLVETNIVFWWLPKLSKDATFTFVKALASLPRPVKMNTVEDGRIRAVMCYEVDEVTVREAVSIIAGQVAKL
jgi:threonine aldolase